MNNTKEYDVRLIPQPVMVRITWIDSFSPEGEWHNLPDLAHALSQHRVRISSLGYLLGWNEHYWLFGGHVAEVSKGEWIIGQSMFIPRRTSVCFNLDGTDFIPN